MSLIEELESPINTFQYGQDRAIDDKRHFTEPRGFYKVSDVSCDIEYLNEQGYGIFFTPNIQLYPDARSSNTVKSIRYQYVDVDNIQDKAKFLAYALSCDLPPSSIVDTASGCHLYYRVSNANINDYHSVQLGLRQYYNGCPSAVGVAGLLRVPSLCGVDIYHHKKTPYQIVLAYDSDITYTQAELKKYFKVTSKVNKKQRQHKTINTSQDMDMIYRLLYKLKPIGHRHMLLFMFYACGIASTMPDADIRAHMLVLSRKWRGQADTGEIDRIIASCDTYLSTYTITGYIKKHRIA